MTTRLPLLPLVFGACLAADEPPPGDVDGAERRIRCPILTCGENGPTAGDGFLFDEFDLWGRENHAGVKLARAYWDDGTPAVIDIVGDDLQAWDPRLGTWRRGADIVTKVILRFEQPASGGVYEVRVADYDDQTVRFRAGDPEFMRLYHLQARKLAGSKKWESVCRPDISLAADPVWSSRPQWAVAYRGDRYDDTKHVIADDPGDGWSFIACAATAGSKLHLHRHTNAGQFDRGGALRWPTSLAERTTLLKAITADYCGDGGDVFTVFGQPLAYATAREPDHLTDPHPSVTSLEALWDDKGVRCLDQPRRAAAGVTREYVEAACGRSIPKCHLSNPPPPSWPASGYVLTGNP